MIQGKLKDTKEVIRNRKSKKDRQHNGQKKIEQKNKQQSIKRKIEQHKPH
jgi:hypothetical protein